MLLTLSDYHKRLSLGLENLHRLCAEPLPDRDSITSARVALNHISLERSRFINLVVIPRMLLGAGYNATRDILILQRSFVQNRTRSEQHIARWTDETIAGDWPGYQRDFQLIDDMMKAQMHDERRLVERYLKHVRI